MFAWLRIIVLYYTSNTILDVLELWLSETWMLLNCNKDFRSGGPECFPIHLIWEKGMKKEKKEKNDWGDGKHFYKSTAQDQEEGVRVGAVLISQKC